MADVVRYGPPERLRGAPAIGRGKLLLRQLVRDRTALLGLAILAALVLVTLFAPLLAPHDPVAQDVTDRYASPSWNHPLGTDQLGRDVLSRLLFGGRISLLSSLVIGAVILLIGVTVGAIAGFVGRWVDDLLMRVVDVLLAFPSFLLALAVVGILGPGLTNLALGLVAVWWAQFARISRGLVLAVRERPYVESARALGLPARRVAVRHVLPGVLSSVIVLWTLETGRLLLALSGLSFLGLGVQPPTPEWGAMLNEARGALARAPQLMLYPGALITLAALGFNLLGDGLRDVLDPTVR